MRRLLFSPRWLARHAVLVVTVTAFVLLGRWQWHRAMSATGGLQNLLYALQWWGFGVVVIVGWSQLVRDELRPRGGRAGAARPGGDAQGTAPAGATAGPGGSPGVVHGRTADPVSAEESAGDEELAAYNRYLSWLETHPRS